MGQDLSVLDESFAIVDIETTGTNAGRDGITEIAVIVMEDWKEKERWSTLLNPGCHISDFIRSLTGISNEMVADAPAFADKAEELMSVLEGRVFVAHNVRFDYGFIRNAFNRADLSFVAPMLCTVKLSRALYPDAHRHNLDSVMRRHGLACEDRHRAMGDADVLLQFLQKMRREQPAEVLESAIGRVMNRPSLPPRLSISDIDALPDSPGVYLFFDENDTCLYVGKSKTVRSRVLSHFSSDYRINKEMEIARQTARVDAVPTAGELGALLKEIDLVRELTPIYNRRLRSYEEAWTIRWSPLKDPIMHPEVVPAESFPSDSEHEYFGLFRTAAQARKRLLKICTGRELCLRTLGLEEGEGACFGRQVGKCTGVCTGDELVIEHKIRVMQALLPIKLEGWPYEGAVAFKESSPDGNLSEAHVFHDWRHLATLDAETELAPENFAHDARLDIDIYNVVTRHVGSHPESVKVVPLPDLDS